MTVLDYERQAPEANGFARVIRILGWAIFLGMSWTWCVGMFLPVLLVRDYGIWGWIVFAIPNVVGAAAVGFLNRSAEQSHATVIAHRPMMLAFSAVTATFQIFFAWWIFNRISPDPSDFTRSMFAVALIVVALPLSRNISLGIIVATFVLIVSMGCIIQCYRSGQMVPFYIYADAIRVTPRSEVLPLAVATCFGFLLCPHLDLSFHRTRQELTASNARLAFGIGLGLVFFAMIIFSLMYSGTILMIMSSYRLGSDPILWFISAYFLVQLAFTTGVHWQAHTFISNKSSPSQFFLMALGTSLLGFACFLAIRFLHTSNFGPGELIYRLFLSFYGLLFPAYVYLCMIPGRGRLAPSRRQWIVLAGSVILAAPLFWLAFIDQKMFYVLPGLAIVLLARLLIRTPKSALETAVS